MHLVFSKYLKKNTIQYYLGPNTTFKWVATMIQDGDKKCSLQPTSKISFGYCGMPVYPGKVRHVGISGGPAPKIPEAKNELVSYITACRDMRGNRVNADQKKKIH